MSDAKAQLPETDLEKVLRQKCDSISAELCDEALAKEMHRPFEIELIDAERIFAALTVEEDKLNWNWYYSDEKPIKEPLIAVLKSRDRQSLRRNFSVSLSEKELLDRLNQKSFVDSGEPVRPRQRIRGAK
jgi:hypothetical protein